MPDPTAKSPEQSSGLWPDLSLLGVAIIWGTNIPLMKLGLGMLDNVYVFNAIRLPVSALVLAAFAFRERRRGIFPDVSIRFWHLAVYAVVVSVLYQFVFLVAMNRTTPGNAALILATTPMWTAILAWIFLRERLRGIAWLGLVVALLGTIVVAVQKGSISGDADHLFGNLAMTASALLWASGTVYSRPLLEKISPLQLAASAGLIGLPAHIAFAILFAKPNQTLALGSVPLWLIVLFSGTLSSGLAQPMWHYGVRKAGAAHAAVVQNLVPLVAIFAAWVVFKTEPTLAQLTGGVLILGGLFLMRMGRRAA